MRTEGLDAWITYIPGDEAYYKCTQCEDIQVYETAFDADYELCNGCKGGREWEKIATE